MFRKFYSPIGGDVPQGKEWKENEGDAGKPVEFQGNKVSFDKKLGETLKDAGFLGQLEDQKIGFLNNPAEYIKRLKEGTAGRPTDEIIEMLKRISDAPISPEDKDWAKRAIERYESGENKIAEVSSIPPNYKKVPAHFDAPPPPIPEKYGEEVQNTVKDFRTRIDSLRLTCETISKFNPSRYLSLSITSFEFARQFFGKILQERGSSTPYSNNDVSRKDVTPEAKMVVELKNKQLQPLELKSTLIELRDIVQDVITDFTVWVDHNSPVSFTEQASQTQVLVELMKGKMRLGEIIGIINESQG